MVKYRTEQLYGSGYRDLKEVISFEIFELGNDDIPLTILSLLTDECKVKASEDLRNMIKDLTEWRLTNEQTSFDKDRFIVNLINIINEFYGKEIKYCLWLSDSCEDIISNYGLESYYDEEKKDYFYEFHAYEDTEAILSDLGNCGKLYGYTEPPEILGENKVLDPKIG